MHFRSARHAGRPSGVEVPVWNSAGDPTVVRSGGGALFTVYNAAGSGETVTVALPAANWHRVGTAAHPQGYRYADKHHRLGPVTKAAVKRNGLISISAGGPSWGYTLDEPLQHAVAVRFQLGLGSRWCAAFQAKASRQGRNDHVGRFVGASNQASAVECREPGG